MALSINTNSVAQPAPQSQAAPAAPQAAPQEATSGKQAEPTMVAISQPADAHSEQDWQAVQALRNSAAGKGSLLASASLGIASAITTGSSGATYRLAGQMVGAADSDSGANLVAGAAQSTAVGTGASASEGFPLLNQYDVASDPNACGPTGLAMILAAEKLIPPTVDAARQLDKETRVNGFGVGASDLVTAAKERGLQGSAQNNSSSDEMRKALERGNRVMAMIDNGGTPHWIDVLEMRSSNEGGETLVYADPATGTQKEMGRAEFESKWNDPMRGKGRLVSALTGYQNMMVAFDKDGNKLPPERLGRALAFDKVADELSNFYEDLETIREGDLRNGLRRATQVPFRSFPTLGSPLLGLPGPSIPTPPPPPNPFRLPNPFGW